MNQRPRREEGLSAPCQYLKGVGPARARDLERLGIETVEQLLLHFPRQWLDRSRLVPLDQLHPGERVSVRGRVMAASERRPRRGMRLLQVTTGARVCSWSSSISPI